MAGIVLEAGRVAERVKEQGVALPDPGFSGADLERNRPRAPSGSSPWIVAKIPSLIVSPPPCGPKDVSRQGIGLAAAIERPSDLLQEAGGCLGCLVNRSQ